VEVRPFWYLFLSYLLAYNLITSKRQLRAFFWIVILGAGVKSFQGLYIFLIVLKGSIQGQNELMAHEESFFFVALILLLILFFLHHRYKPQLYVTLLLLPGVLVSLVANNRRTDYIALLVGVMVAWALLFVLKPRMRLGLVAGLVICGMFLAGYVLAFAHSSGSLAAPARAILSIINPASADARDAASNLYRVVENYDLKFTVKQSPLIGMGFGLPFLQPIALPNISGLDQYYLFVPHNTIYWVWMRLGAIGFMALWYLFGSIIVRGCLIVRQIKDPYLQVVAIYIVAVTFMEVVVAFADYQLFFYRNVIYLGLLAGILVKLPLLDKEKETPVHETARIVLLPALPDVG
ncbi:MAG TPA: O-antigen ligase family protein, partial [Ktedonobacteraceae bacterium]|nr:O-antigen ligase family protein [Ktedonobacteraceae bacterium]